MKNEINFLPKQLVRQDSLSKSVKWLRLIALILIFVIPVLSVILFLLTFFSPLTQYQYKEKDLLSSTQGLSNKIAKMQFIVDRSNKAAQYLNNRNIYDQVISSVYAQTPSDIDIISLGIHDNIVTIEAQSPSLLSLQNFERNLKNITIVHLTNFQTASLENSIHGDYFDLVLNAKIK